MATALPDRSARLNMRVAPDALGTIRDAASAQQQDVTSFVLGAALDRARAVLAEERLMQLTEAEVEQVGVALGAAPRQIPELARLIREVREQRVMPQARLNASPELLAQVTDAIAHPERAVPRRRKR